MGVIERYEEVASSAIMANYYRILGQSSLPFSIEEMIRYIEAEVAGEGRYGGRLNWLSDNEMFKLFRWDNIRVGEDLYFDMYVWGKTNGRNTVFTRVGFTRMYVLRMRIEREMGLPQYSLSLRSTMKDRRW